MKTTTLISDAIAQIRGTIEDKKAENIIEYFKLGEHLHGMQEVGGSIPLTPPLGLNKYN